jgi:hypothetical protein
MSENEVKQQGSPLRQSVVRDEFNLSASDKLIAPLLPIVFSVSRENEMKQRIAYRRHKFGNCRDLVLWEMNLLWVLQIKQLLLFHQEQLLSWVSMKWSNKHVTAENERS